MKKYEFHIGTCPYNGWKNIESWLVEMQNKSWEFIGLIPPVIRNGYTDGKPGFIFRREIVECFDSDNIK